MKKISIISIVLIIILLAGLYVQKLNKDKQNIAPKDTMVLFGQHIYRDKKLPVTIYNLSDNSIVGKYEARLDHEPSFERFFDKETGDFFYTSEDGVSEMDGSCFSYEKDGSCLKSHIYKDNVFDNSTENELLYNPDSMDTRFNWVYDTDNKTLYVFEEQDNTITYYSVNPQTKEKNKIKTLTNPNDKSMFFGIIAVNTQKGRIAQQNYEKDLNYFDVIYTDIKTGESETKRIDSKVSPLGSSVFSPDLEKLVTSKRIIIDDSYEDNFVVYDIKSGIESIVPMHEGYSIGNYTPHWSPESNGVFINYNRNIKYSDPKKEGARLVYFDTENRNIKTLIEKDQWGINIYQVSDSGRYILLGLFDLINREENDNTYYYLDTTSGNIVNLIKSEDKKITEKETVDAQEKIKDDSKVLVYSSKNLGVQFSYAKEGVYGALKISPVEYGNRISLVEAGNLSDITEYLEVYSKDSKQSLVDAVNKQFIIGKPNKNQNCIALSKNDTSVEITDKRISTEDKALFIKGSGLNKTKYLGMKDFCVSVWDSSNSLTHTNEAYMFPFYIDPSFPDRFYYINHATQATPPRGTSDKKYIPWTETVKLIPKN